ncbi:MAG TPA: hypothetical protein VH816_13355 [Gaiellaceae bacterium]|jgi:hypothetical protein
MSLRPVLRPLELLRVLVEQDVEFVVIGGFSLAAYGVQRATKDVDVVPDPERSNLERLYEALRGIDARPIELDDFEPRELPVAFDLEALLAGGNWALSTELGRIDLMQWLEGVDYRSLRSRAEFRDVPGAGRVWFAGREDLIAMKLAAGRPQDLVDVESLRRR